MYVRVGHVNQHCTDLHDCLESCGNFYKEIDFESFLFDEKLGII